MHKVEQGAVVAAVVVMALLVTIGCPSSFAEDTFGRRPVTAGDLPDQLLVPPAEDFSNDTTWVPPEAKPDDRSWTQRIVQLARGRTQLEGGYSYLRGSAGGSDWTQHALPDMLLRFGLTDRLELRLGWPGYVSSGSDDPAIGGAGLPERHPVRVPVLKAGGGVFAVARPGIEPKRMQAHLSTSPCSSIRLE